WVYELGRRAREAGLPVDGMAAQPGLTRSHPPGPRLLDAALGLAGDDPQVAALPVVMASVADLPGGAYVAPSGFASLSGPPAPARPSRRTQDLLDAQRLWALSEEATGVRYP
ncbi:MAG: short-chain dehydrogenase, partial [Nocardioidaceae bacterium]|nr:short-chain dehydrogenase [Nocardioidaceae bacterium]